MKCKHCNGRDFDTKSAGSTGLYICRGCGSSTADRPILEFRDSTPDNETADHVPASELGIADEEYRQEVKR